MLREASLGSGIWDQEASLAVAKVLEQSVRAGEVGRGSWRGPGPFRGRNWALEEVRAGAHAVELAESGEEGQYGRLSRQRQSRGRAGSQWDP